MANEENLNRLTERIIDTLNSAEDATHQGVRNLVANVKMEAVLDIMVLIGLPSIILVLLVVYTVVAVVFFKKGYQDIATDFSEYVFLILGVSFLLSCVVSAFHLPEAYAKLQEPAGWAIRQYLSG